MKTSNKILLSTFLAVLFIIVGVHIALYAKYKNGDYRIVTDDMWPTNMVTYSLQEIKYVSVNNVENVTIEAADSSKLQYEKAEEGEENILSVTKKNDTLFLTGKSSNDNHGRWYRRMNLSLAGPLPVKVINSQLHVKNPTTAAPFSMDITLDKSFMEVNRENSNSTFASLKIDATNGSRISLFNVNAHLLHVKLRNSVLKENILNADSIILMTDLTSKIELSGKNLAKSKIVNYE